MLGALALGLLGGLVLWLMVHHVPGWYVPVYVPEARMDQVRADAINRYNRIGDSMVRRTPFEVVLDENQVSEWVAARERIWPQAGAWIPGWLHDPIIRFRNGRIITAARVEADGYRCIAGAHLSIELGADDILVVRLDRVTIGSLPVPLGALAGPVGGVLRMKGRDLDLMPLPVADVAEYFRESEPMAALSEGIRRANRFIWENGRRPYRIAGIKIADGKLTLTIEPR